MNGKRHASPADCRIYIRPEGDHYVGLCAELQKIVCGQTIAEVVRRAKAMMAAARLSPVDGREIRIVVRVSKQTSLRAT